MPPAAGDDWVAASFASVVELSDAFYWELGRSFIFYFTP
jgi:hypothetical protein